MEDKCCGSLNLDWPYDAPIPDVHCPVCGRVVLNCGGYPEDPICPHLDIIWSQADGVGEEIKWVHPKHKEVAERALAERHEDGDVGRVLRFDGPDPVDAVIAADPDEPYFVITWEMKSPSYGPCCGTNETIVVLLRPFREIRSHRDGSKGSG